MNITRPVRVNTTTHHTNCSLSGYKKGFPFECMTNQSDDLLEKNFSTVKAYFDNRLCARDHGCSRWNGLDVGRNGWYRRRCNYRSLRRLWRRAWTRRGWGGRGQCWSLRSFCHRRMRRCICDRTKLVYLLKVAHLIFIVLFQPSW